jgi:hypothetical protein
MQILKAMLCASMAMTTSCKDADHGQRTENGVIPMERNYNCISNTVSDLGPTKESEILTAIPGGLKVGIRLSEIEKVTKWSKTTKDYLTYQGKRSDLSYVYKSRKINATTLDFDLNGTVDWIYIVGTTGDPLYEHVTSHMQSGQHIISNHLDKKSGCSYDHRIKYTSSEFNIGDAEIAAGAYCSAENSCYLGSRHICNKLPSSSTMTIDTVIKHPGNNSYILKLYGFGGYSYRNKPINTDRYKGCSPFIEGAWL